MPRRPSQPHLAHRLRTLSLTSTPVTALFYARIYRALFPPTTTEHDSLHILALCFLAADQPYPALNVVRDSADADAEDHIEYSAANGIDDDLALPRRPGCYGCALIVAKCCHRLSRFSEGQAVLERALRNSSPMTLPTPTPIESSATASLLLATLSHKGKASAQAAEYYQRALTDDPWLWEAFTGLCDIGSAPAVETLFPDPPTVIRSSSARTTRHPTLSPNPMPRSSASEVPNFLNRRQLSPLATGPPNGGFFTPEVGGATALPSRLMMGNSSWDTPSLAGDTTFEQGPSQIRRPLPNLISAFIPSASSMLPASLRSTPNPVSDIHPAKPPAMKRARGGNALRKPVETPVTTTGPLATESRLNGREHKAFDLVNEKLVEPPVRRSSRLNTGSGGKVAPRIARETRSTRSRSVTSSASGATIEATSPASTDVQVQSIADDWLRDVLRRCAKAYRALSLYHCQEALSEIDTLPQEIQNSAWAYDIAARCFYEMSNYTLSGRAFKALLAEEPYRLESMEQYSTLLWHTGDSSALSHLSQVLISIDREAPQPWIAAGNCFSLQREHDEAMRCFRRAAQIAPACAYAWTLCGYEAFEMEEFERAIAFYRTAIRADARHYNAWYGMGLVYLKTGKHRHAEHHFRRASEINPSNAVLLCCIGTVLETLGNLSGALALFEQACKYAADNAMVQFKRVRALVSLARLEEAIHSLESLTRSAPDEANVFFLLGKCYLRIGRNAEATIALTTARELQPKLEAAIRATMLSRGEDTDDEDDED